MSENYPGTSVPFENYELPDLHDPVMLGPGAESLQATSQVYGSLAETLDKAVGDLRAVLAKSQHAQQGQAADAARQHVVKVVSAGEAGAEHARLATYALQEQAAYFARARTDMLTAADTAAGPLAPQLPAGKGGANVRPEAYVPSEHARTVAVDGAHLYQNNSNHNLTYIFQGFDPPQIAAPDVSTGAQPQAPGWGGGASSSAAPTVGPAGTDSGVAPTGVAPAAPTTAAPTPAAPTPAAPITGGPGGSAAVPPAAAVPLLPLTPAAAGGRAGGVTTPGGPSLTPGSTAPTPSAASQTPPGGPRVGASLPGVSPKPADPAAGRSGWAPGQPWTSRPDATPLGTTPLGTRLPGSTLPGTDPFGRSPAGGAEPRSGVGAEPRTVSGRPSAPGAVEPGASTTSPSSRTSTTGQPFMPMGAGGGGGQGTEHSRPSWLVEDDPEKLWMSGLPPHGPAVIEPLED